MNGEARCEIQDIRNYREFIPVDVVALAKGAPKKKGERMGKRIPANKGPSM